MARTCHEDSHRSHAFVNVGVTEVEPTHCSLDNRVHDALDFDRPHVMSPSCAADRLDPYTRVRDECYN